MGIGIPYKQITESGVIKNRTGVLRGFICVASSSGTLTVYDNATAGSGTVIIPTTNLTAGQIVLLDDGVQAVSGIYAAIGGTSATVNVLYE